MSEIETTEMGYLVNAEDWSEELATQMATDVCRCCRCELSVDLAMLRYRDVTVCLSFACAAAEAGHHRHSNNSISSSTTHHRSFGHA